jgi:hypothetical protein
LKSPLFLFECSRDAALRNAIVLEQFNFDVDKAIKHQSDSQVSYGSEFKKPQHIQELLEDHPHWNNLKNILTNGAEFPLIPLSREDRSNDLSYHKDRGNHKSARDHQEIMDQIILDDIEKGFALPLPPEIIYFIPNASLAPLGCQKQETINKQGERIPKYQMMHDQSFPGLSGNSVNQRVVKEKLPPCMYSFVLLRSIHYIVNLRLKHLRSKIFLCKFDLDAAYRRCHLSGKTASECLTIHNNILLMAIDFWRLTLPLNVGLYIRYYGRHL